MQIYLFEGKPHTQSQGENILHRPVLKEVAKILLDIIYFQHIHRFESIRVVR